MDKKLTVKDFVNIGVFAVVYFVVIFAVGMMGVVPILFLVYPTIGGIVAGTVVMLFMAKTAKPWAFLIFGMLTPILMFIMGHTYLLPLGSLAVTLIAELVRRSGGYRSLAKEKIATGRGLTDHLAGRLRLNHKNLLGLEILRSRRQTCQLENLSNLFLWNQVIPKGPTSVAFANYLFKVHCHPSSASHLKRIS